MAVFHVEVHFLVQAEDNRDAVRVLDKHIGGGYVRMDDPEPYRKELDAFDSANLIG